MLKDNRSADSELARLDALKRLKILDTPPSECFDRITRLASRYFSLPIAAISLTDTDRQWFQSRVGVDLGEIPRERAPCSMVAETSKPLIISDFLADPYYSDSFLAHAGIRFYAGTPLLTNCGYGLGALCVLGTEPRQTTSSEIKVLNDLSRMVMAQIELRHAFGRIDPTSGLSTRNQFCEDLIDLASEFPGQKRYAIVVDLARDDQLTKIRRALGGQRIVEMIRKASDTLQDALGPNRNAYRIGMMHLAFLSPPDVDIDEYTHKLKAKLAALQTTSTVRFVTNIAIGIRPFILGETNPEELLRGATNAAFDAKQSDEPIAFYCAKKEAAHKRQFDLMRDFGLALEAKDQLRLVYQPRIDLATGRCIGAEALLRWRHPKFGDVSPAEFIPIIEQTTLARPATQWVLEAAMDQLAQWQEAGNTIGISVNISASNLSETDLLERIQTGLAARNIAPDKLEIEITESAIMEQPNQAITTLQDISKLGIRLAIDDFGTGHSSLAYLQNLPANILKVDRSFIHNLVDNEGSVFVLVEAMVALAHKLGFTVVVEGVETAEAADILTEIGCEEAQGFWFSRPVEAEHFGQWLHQ